MKCMLWFFASFLIAPLAAAQTVPPDTSYDPNRNCHYYVVSHLPAPVRCMTELLGSWGPHTYVAEGLVFRDQSEYRAWQNRTASPGKANAVPATKAAPAQAGLATLRSVLCPREATVKIVAASATASDGWRLGEREALGRLDSSNPPHSSGAILSCYYALGQQRGAFMLNRPAGDRECTARSDGTGFDCSIPPLP
jgi:hypothetical protein